MSDDLERLNRLLDSLAAESSPADRASLSADEAQSAETAAWLKSASAQRSAPDPDFVARLGEHLAASQGEVARSAANPPARDKGVSRRGLLGRAIVAAAGAAVGAGAGEVVRGEIDRAAADTAYQRGFEHAVKGVYHAPLVPSDRGRWIDTSHKAAGVTPGQAVRFRTGAVEGFLVNPGNGRPIYALSAACTHMGCLITWLDGAGTFLCPCHGAQYDADGSVLNGVARRPLPRLSVRREKDGSLYVWAVGEHPTVTTLAPYNSD